MNQQLQKSNIQKLNHTQTLIIIRQHNYFYYTRLHVSTF